MGSLGRILSKLNIASKDIDSQKIDSKKNGERSNR